MPEPGSNPAAKRRKSVIETVEPLLAEVASTQNVTLYDLEYVKEGGERILRLYIDKDGGVDLNDCERVSRAAEAVLDEHDPVPDAYILEVSSPGIERRLRKDEHFARYAGERVELRLFKPVDGQKKFRGILGEMKEGVITITDSDGVPRAFGRKDISVCRLSVFD